MARKRPRKIDKILAEAKALLSAQYADRLKGVVLFGSYARGDFTEGSDIDLLALLSHLADPLAESDPIFPAVCDLSLKHDIVLSIVLMVNLTFQVGTAQALFGKDVVQRVNAGKTLALLNEFVNLHVLGKLLKRLPYFGRDNHPLSVVYVFNVYHDFSLLRRMCKCAPGSSINSNPLSRFLQIINLGGAQGACGLEAYREKLFLRIRPVFTINSGAGRYRQPRIRGRKHFSPPDGSQVFKLLAKWRIYD